MCILVLSSHCHLYFTYNITWFDDWLFFVFDIAWCMCCGDYGLSFGGRSYSSVDVPPPVFVFPMVLIVCIPTFFYFFPSYFFLYSCFLVHIAPGFIFSQLSKHLPQLDETFGGCMHMYFIICSYMCILKYVYSI